MHSESIQDKVRYLQKQWTSRHKHMLSTIDYCYPISIIIIKNDSKYELPSQKKTNSKFWNEQ